MWRNKCYKWISGSMDLTILPEKSIRLYKMKQNSKKSPSTNSKVTMDGETWRLFNRASFLIRGNKSPTRCKRLVFIAELIVRSTCFAPLCPSSGAQDLYRWLLPMVLGALVYRSLVWCGAVGYVSGLRDVSRLVKLLMMGIMVTD